MLKFLLSVILICSLFCVDVEAKKHKKPRRFIPKKHVIITIPPHGIMLGLGVTAIKNNKHHLKEEN